MTGRNSSEFCKVDAPKESTTRALNADQPAPDAGQRTRKSSVELCQNGVCAVTWKPGKTVAA
jgi:hypothetical protein